MLVCFYVICAFFSLVNAVQISKLQCEGVWDHPNYGLLPKKMECGVNNIPYNLIFEGVLEWANNSAKIGEFPWLAYLEVQRKHKHVSRKEQYNWVDYMNCTGSLINNRYILTAAHCFNKSRSYYTRVSARLGRWWLPWDERNCEQDACSNTRVIYNAEQIIRHHDLTNDGNNDVCLLRMNAEIEFNEYIRPICLPTSCFWQRKDFTCYEMTLADAGRLKRIGGNRYIKSMLVEKYDYLMQDQEWCVKQFRKKRVIMDSQMCVGGLTWRHACKGDPGAPLTLDLPLRGKMVYYLVGMLGYKRDCHTPWGDYYVPPAVYTKVSPFVRWILDHMQP